MLYTLGESICVKHRIDGFKNEVILYYCIIFNVLVIFIK